MDNPLHHPPGVPRVEKPRAEGQFHLSDGRKLGYAEFGDPEGPVILWFHGTLGGAPALGEELASGAECAVEPQDHRALGIAEFRVAEFPTIGEVELTFGPRLFDTRYAGRVVQWVVH